MASDFRARTSFLLQGQALASRVVSSSSTPPSPGTSTTTSSSSKLSPGGLRQFTLSPVRDDDRTQELGLTLLGRVPMPASYPHLALA